MVLDLDFFDSKPSSKPVDGGSLLDLSAIPVLEPTKPASKALTPSHSELHTNRNAKPGVESSSSVDTALNTVSVPADGESASRVTIDGNTTSSDAASSVPTIGEKASSEKASSEPAISETNSVAKPDTRTELATTELSTTEPASTKPPTTKPPTTEPRNTDVLFDEENQCTSESTVQDGDNHGSIPLEVDQTDGVPSHSGIGESRLGGEPNADQLATDAFLAVARYCDIETIKSLLLVSQNSHRAAVSDQIWKQICAALDIPENTAEDDLIGTSVNPSNILQAGRVKGENSACRTFSRAYSILKPVIDDPQQYSHEAEPSELLDRSHTLSNAQKLARVLPGLFNEATVLNLDQVVSSEQNRLLTIIADHSQTATKPSSKIFSSCEVYLQSDEQFRDKVIGTYFSHLLTEPIVQDAFTNHDDAEGISTKVVSQEKMEQAFSSVMATLIAVNTEITDPESILPPKWNQSIWLYMASKLIAHLVVYVRQVLDEATRDISEEAYLAAVPQLYASSRILTENSIVNEIGSGFDFDFAQHVATDLLRPVLDEFCERQTLYVNTFAKRKVRLWNESLSQREDETEKYIWSSVPKKSDKYSFISSFKWAFTSSTDDISDAAVPDSSASSTGAVTKAPATEFEAQTAVLVSKLRGMESLVSIELVIEVMDTCRTAIRRLKNVHREDPKLCQIIFCTFLNVIGGRHIQPAFDRALKVLNSYDPKKYGRLMISMNKEQHALPTPEYHEHTDAEDSDVAVEPLVVFTELVNVGDLVQQMVHVFFEEELVATKMIRKSDFGAPSVNAKRKFEQLLDDMLAAGLSRGIDVLMDQVEFTMVTEQLGSDYMPPPVNASTFGPTVAAEKVISLVKSHLDLLRETTEKNLYEVFQHEVGVRLYTALSKHIKSQIISEEGAVTLISDINAYYNFVLSLRQRSLLPYYETLKQIAQLFLIDKKDAKQIGLAMSDSDRYNGLVTTEELIEFVRRRRDWPSIKSKVEKTLYGVFECIIC